MKPENPPAFPMGYHPEGNSADQSGMTLRDYFAIHAPSDEVDNMFVDDKVWCANLIGIEGQHYDCRIHYKLVISKLRYQYADAMLHQRKIENDKDS